MAKFMVSLTEDERAYLHSALHTEGVLTGDVATEARIREKLCLVREEEDDVQ